MQQFKEELKNIPTDASQVCSSINSQLNREETLSVESKVLSLNNGDVNQSGNTQSFKNIKVFVISKQGLPLMPCSPTKNISYKNFNMEDVAFLSQLK